MKKGSFNKMRKALAFLIAVAMVFTLIPDLGGAAKAAGEIGSISVTKEVYEPDGDTQLKNTRTETDSIQADSVTMGYDDTGGGQSFNYAKVNVAAAKAAPDGLDFPIVHGNNKDVVGTANIKIITKSDGKDYIRFTILNYSPNSKKWDVLAWDTMPGGNMNPLVKHPYTGPSADILLPVPNNGEVDVYFHGQGIECVIYRDVAFDFEFQIIDKATGLPVPITPDNITFRGKSQDPPYDVVMVENGGAIVGNGRDGKFTVKNGITALISGLPAGAYVIRETTYDAYITEIRPSGEEGSVAEITISENGEVQSVTFANIMKSYKLTVGKTVTGDGAPAEAEFEVVVTFDGPAADSIKEASGTFTTADGGKTWTGKLAHGGSVVFSLISLGTTYTIAEPNLRPSFNNEDSTTYNDAKITGAITAHDETEALINHYDPVAELTLKANKSIDEPTGDFNPPSQWSFNFDLYQADIDGEPLGSRLDRQAAATSGGGIATFKTLGFKTAEKGDHYFLIKEVTDDLNGWIPDPAVYHIKAVVDDSSGTLEVTEVLYRTDLSSDPEEPASWTPYAAQDDDFDFSPNAFTNTYQPKPAKLALPFNKTLRSGPSSGSFRFSLTFGDDVIYKSITTGGNYSFDPIDFDTPGEYILEIAEEDPGDRWIRSAPAPITVYVDVTDDGTGQLAAKAYKSEPYISANEIKAGGDLPFVNTFIPAPITAPLKLTKTVDGDPVSSWSFEFGIYESDASGAQRSLLKTVTVSESNSSPAFDSPEMSADGAYYFLIKELSTSGNNWTVSTREYLIQITVTKNSGTGALSWTQRRFKTRTGPSASWTPGGASWSGGSSYTNYSDSSFTFNNTYENVVGRTSLTLSGRKTVNAGAPNQIFSFVVTDGGGTPVSWATSNGPGDFIFAPTLVFTEPGYYQFTIAEDTAGLAYGWEPQTSPKTIYIQVTEDAEEHLFAELFDEQETPFNTADLRSYLTFENYNDQSKFDLALLKYVSAVNGKGTGQDGSGSPTPPNVRRGDKVTFTIKVVNQGDLDGFVKEITDYIPEGLDFMADDNLRWGWEYDEETRTAWTETLSGVLLREGDTATVEIVLRVSDLLTEADSGSILRNIAAISRHGDKDGNDIENGGDDDEDDADVKFVDEPVFDLALLKYVSAVNGVGTGQTGYEKPAGVPLVNIGDKVTFTIKVLNQGDLDGYVEEIVDYIPAGFDFVQEDNMSWIYDDSDPNLRMATTSALYYNKLIAGKATYPPEESTATWDIVLTVNQDARRGSTLRNIAEISIHSDENRDRTIQDVDSTPDKDPWNDVVGGDNIIDNTNDDEDDHDYADVRVKVINNDEGDDDGDGDGDGDGDRGGTPEPPPPPPPPEPPTVADVEGDGDSDSDGDGDGDTGERIYQRGGNDQGVPPAPNTPGNTLVPDGDGFLEFDENGVPLGKWDWDDDQGEWIFDEFPPLGNLPQTGNDGAPPYMYIPGALLIALGLTLRYTDKKRGSYQK